MFGIAKPVLHHLCITADHHQQIVEIVCYAAGQLTQRFHLLRIGELLLCALQLRPCLMAFSDVAHDIGEPDELAFLVADRVDHHGRKEQRPILANTPAVVFVGSRGGGHSKSAFGSTGPSTPSASAA